MKDYTVIYERGTRNWSAYVPDTSTSATIACEYCAPLEQDAASRAAAAMQARFMDGPPVRALLTPGSASIRC